MDPTRKYLTDYLLKCNKLEIYAEKIRQSIAGNPYFQTFTVFARFDKFRSKGYLQPADLSEFLLDNHIYPTESELFMIFRDFDRDRTGIISFDEFEQQLLPRQNTKLKNEVLARHPYPAEPKLSTDLEYLLSRYFEDKINTIKVFEEIREKIQASRQYADDQCFLDLDVNRVGYLQSQKNIDAFLRRNGQALKNEELSRIYRVLSFHSGTQITIEMFRQHLAPFHSAVYPGYRQKIHEKQALYHRFRTQQSQIQKAQQLNQYKRAQLSSSIADLRGSNRRLHEIMDEQEIQQMGEIYRYHPY